MLRASDQNQHGSQTLHPLALRRVRSFLSIVLLVALGLSLKMVYVQVVRRAHYMALDRNRTHGPDPGPPLPGAIYARDLEPMAVSVPTVAICADPVQVAASEQGIDGTAREIAACTGLDAGRLRDTLVTAAAESDTFEYLARLLDPDSVTELAEVGLDGVWTMREYKRVYPGDRLACHVLGRCSKFHEPKDGAELRWAFLLAGRPGTRPKNMDAYGRSILGADSSGVLPPEPGKSLVLTIDWSLQQVVEMALDDCMVRNRPVSATCLVMDPRTGEILALASRPNFNPAGLEPGTPAEIHARLRNLPVVRQYEPGSLFKVLLAAAVLESPEWNPNTTFYCAGQTEIAGEPLRCWEPEGHGRCDLEKMVAKSCNVAAAHFALLIGAEHYHHFLSLLGLGHRTGIELPGEVPGTLRPAEDMQPRDLATLGFGQGVAVNDIQMAAAVSAVVNGGLLMQPHVVRAVLDPASGRAVRELPPVEIRRVCAEETSARVREMMGAVIERGTGTLARIEGVRTGGKTGTAQQWSSAEGGYVEGRNLVSFVMVAPLDAPRFVILVTADRPEVGRHGAEVAAPVARTVALAALRNAGLLPEQVEINENIGV